MTKTCKIRSLLPCIQYITSLSRRFYLSSPLCLTFPLPLLSFPFSPGDDGVWIGGVETRDRRGTSLWNRLPFKPFHIINLPHKQKTEEGIYPGRIGINKANEPHSPRRPSDVGRGRASAREKIERCKINMFLPFLQLSYLFHQAT